MNGSSEPPAGRSAGSSKRGNQPGDTVDSPSGTKGDFANVRDFAVRVAKALAAQGVASTTLRNKVEEVPQRKTLFGRVVPATYRDEVAVEGWKVWEQRLLYIEWVHRRMGGLGGINETHCAIWLAEDGALHYVETEQVMDNQQGYTRSDFVRSRPASNDDLQAADFKYRAWSGRQKGVHHDFREWNKADRWAPKPGVGLSAALRNLADQHGVLPRRSPRRSDV